MSQCTVKTLVSGDKRELIAVPIDTQPQAQVRVILNNLKEQGVDWYTPVTAKDVVLRTDNPYRQYLSPRRGEYLIEGYILLVPGCCDRPKIKRENLIKAIEQIKSVMDIRVEVRP